MAGAIGGAISGFSDIKQGKAIEKAGQQGIDNFEWQDLSNPYKELTASTVGADMQREEAARNAATSVNALRSGGVRGIVGGVGRVQAQNNLVNKEIAAKVDEDTKQIQMAAAGQDVYNQNMIEKRQQDELAGYGNMVDVGRDMRRQGAASLVAAGTAIDEAGEKVVGALFPSVG